MNQHSNQTVYGEIDALIEYNDGRKPKHWYRKNTVVNMGRTALAACLANDITDEFDYYISRMLFGSNGTTASGPKYVDASRNGLFGAADIWKPVIASIDPDNTNQVVFTSVLSYDEVVGVVLSEMALQMANGNLYSMTTFPDLSKTAQMQITWNWRITFV